MSLLRFLEADPESDAAAFAQEADDAVGAIGLSPGNETGYQSLTSPRSNSSVANVWSRTQPLSRSLHSHAYRNMERNANKSNGGNALLFSSNMRR